jgi:hypothetical protein
MADWFEERRPQVRGGAARGGPSGSIHLSFRSGSRGGGASAAAAFAYVTRTDQFADRELDEALYTESGHMPAWAEPEPSTYWDAADLFERANGRLYLSADFALPRGLDVDDQVALAKGFVHHLTDSEQLPYTLAIHAGRTDEGAEHNPHAHVLISERMNDGIARDREQWFRRANREYPARGGAPKSRTFHGSAWMERARSRWADITNRAMADRGRPERVDHRSYARQGIAQEPGRHFGPAAAYMLAKGRAHERLGEASGIEDSRGQLEALDDAIASLERERAQLVDRESREPSPDGGSGVGGRSGKRAIDRDDDLGPER